MCVDKNKNEKKQKKNYSENPERGIQAKTQKVWLHRPLRKIPQYFQSDNNLRIS